MEKATISQLKDRLSAYLKRVRAGQVIIIFDRDQPIARLERIEEHDDPQGRLARLERAGLVRRPRAALPLKMLKTPGPKSKRSVTQALLDERLEGR